MVDLPFQNYVQRWRKDPARHAQAEQLELTAPEILLLRTLFQQHIFYFFVKKTSIVLNHYKESFINKYIDILNISVL